MHTKIVQTRGDSTPDLVLFYQSSSPFSNFHPAEFRAKNGEFRSFTCSEQYFMYQKAVFAGDREAAEEVLRATNPFRMKRIGRSLKMDQRMLKSWDLESRDVMYRGCFEKFTQNADLRRFLLRTHGMKLAEASPTDCVWGIGLHINDPLAHDPCNWYGENRLGTILERIREEIWDMEMFRTDREVIEKEDMKTRRRGIENFRK